jgi:hypothetical protein
MKSSFIIYQDILERFTEDDQIENIILGTGVMARDLQAKLRLLNLKAPFLVGGRDDLRNGIWHYERLNELEKPERYRFIVCFDVDEWVLIAPVQSIVFRLLGIASYNHPNIIRLTSDPVLYERAGELLTDAHIHNIILKNDRPYALFGEEHDNAFNIHIFGASCSSSIFSYSQYSWSELLFMKLFNENFNAAVYSWGQPLEALSDCLLQFLRDGYRHKPNLVILYKGEAEFDPLRIGKKNILPIRTGVGSHEYIRWMQSTYKEDKSNGIDHAVDIFEIWTVQLRIFKALAKLLGFTFWAVIPPSGTLLPEEQSKQLLGLSSGYLARVRKRKDIAVSAVEDCLVKDYTDSFAGIDNIFEMYADITHLTDSGNNIIAERCAKDILTMFKSK